MFPQHVAEALRASSECVRHNRQGRKVAPAHCFLMDALGSEAYEMSSDFADGR